MRLKNAFMRSLTTHSTSGALITGMFVASMACMAACGSDKKGEVVVTKPNGETEVTPVNTKPGTTTPTTVVDPNSGTAVTTTGDVNTVNSDKTGNEPTLSPLSNAIKATPAAGTAINMPFVQLQKRTNPSVASKTWSLTTLDYDPCIFGFRHGYSVFPVGKFNFGGFYLVNGTPGADLVAGTYTAGTTTGMYIDSGPTISGSGYGIAKCKATSYASVTSGTIVIDTLGVGGATTSGTMDVTMSDGSKFTGAFGTGACAGGPTVQPTPPTPDPYACSQLN